MTNSCVLPVQINSALETHTGSWAELQTDGDDCTPNPGECREGWTLAAWFKSFSPYVSKCYIGGILI